MAVGAATMGVSIFDGGRDYFAELAGWDSSGDGIVNGEDANLTALQIWQDRNEDGQTQEGELFSLAEPGITALSANGTEVNIQTASGTTIRSESFANDRNSQVKTFAYPSNDNEIIFDRVAV